MYSNQSMVKNVGIQNIAFVVCIIAVMSLIFEYLGSVTFKLGTAVTLFPRPSTH